MNRYANVSFENNDTLTIQLTYIDIIVIIIILTHFQFFWQLNKTTS